MSEAITLDESQPADAGPSIHDDLVAAFAASEAAEGAQPTGTAPQPPTPAPKQPAQQAPAQTDQGAQPRADNGQFAPKGKSDQSPQSPQPPASGQPAEPPSPGTIAPPPSWSAAAKAEFGKLPPVIQQEVLKREGDMQTGKAQWQQGAERLNRLDGVLSPLQERLRVNGVDEATFVGQLVAANDWLDRDPVSALLELGRQKGVDWRALGARLQGQPPQQQAALPPQLQALAGQVQSLTQWMRGSQQQQQQAAMQGYADQVHAFGADPKNIYFENVKERMSQLIRAGAAKTLDDAYSQACWADPEVRPLMMQGQQADQTAKAAADAKAAANARHASGSITGSPTHGSSPGGGGQGSQSLRDALSEAWDANS